MDQEKLDLKKKKLLKTSSLFYVLDCIVVVLAAIYAEQIMTYLSKFDSTYISTQNLYGLLTIYFTLSTVLMIKAYTHLNKKEK